MVAMTEEKPLPIRIDERGRISLPAKLRKALGLDPGDTVFARRVGKRVELMKGENPFDGLAGHAIEEYRAGRTRSLEAFAEEHDIPLDDA